MAPTKPAARQTDKATTAAKPDEADKAVGQTSAALDETSEQDTKPEKPAKPAKPEKPEKPDKQA